MSFSLPAYTATKHNNEPTKNQINPDCQRLLYDCQLSLISTDSAKLLDIEEESKLFIIRRGTVELVFNPAISYESHEHSIFFYVSNLACLSRSFSFLIISVERLENLAVHSIV